MHYDWHFPGERMRMSESPSHSFPALLTDWRHAQDEQSSGLAVQARVRGVQTDFCPLRSDPHFAFQSSASSSTVPHQRGTETPPDLTWCCLTLCYTLSLLTEQQKVFKLLYTTPTHRHTHFNRGGGRGATHQHHHRSYTNKNAHMTFRTKRKNCGLLFWPAGQMPQRWV